jgi:hypothetical protein
MTTTLTRIGSILVIPLSTAGGILLFVAVAGLLGIGIASKPTSSSMELANQRNEFLPDEPSRSVLVKRNLVLAYGVMVYTLLPVFVGAAILPLACFRSYTFDLD